MTHEISQSSEAAAFKWLCVRRLQTFVDRGANLTKK